MSSIISKIADEIALHGSYEAYEKFRDKEEDIPYFPDPEVVPHVSRKPCHNFRPGGIFAKNTNKEIIHKME